jgi:hypothetical protein
MKLPAGMMTISGQLLQSLKTVTVSASAVVERKLNIIQMERMDDSLYGLDCATVLRRTAGAALGKIGLAHDDCGRAS